VVIFVHGGYWRRGDRSYFEPLLGLYGNVGVALARQGVIAAVVSYRLFPEVHTVADMLDDVAAATRHVRDHIADFGGDPAQIYWMGHSAGAHLVSLLASAPDARTARGLHRADIRGVIAVSGVYDVVTSAHHARPRRLRETLWRPLFGDAAQQRAASPLHHLATGDPPPMLFLVAERDYPACLRDFEAVRRLWTARWSRSGQADSRARFVRLPEQTHEEIVLAIGAPEDQVTPEVLRFLRRARTPGTPTRPARQPLPPD